MTSTHIQKPKVIEQSGKLITQLKQNRTDKNPNNESVRERQRRGRETTDKGKYPTYGKDFDSKCPARNSMGIGGITAIGVVTRGQRVQCHSLILLVERKGPGVLRRGVPLGGAV